MKMHIKRKYALHHQYGSFFNGWYFDLATCELRNAKHKPMPPTDSFGAIVWAIDDGEGEIYIDLNQILVWVYPVGFNSKIDGDQTQHPDLIAEFDIDSCYVVSRKGNVHYPKLRGHEIIFDIDGEIIPLTEIVIL